MTYYLKLDKERKPRRLLRADGGAVDVWFQGEWRRTSLMKAELDGLGGSSDYFQVPSGQVKQWKGELNG